LCSPGFFFVVVVVRASLVIVYVFPWFGGGEVGCSGRAQTERKIERKREDSFSSG